MSQVQRFAAGQKKMMLAEIPGWLQGVGIVLAALLGAVFMKGVFRNLR